MATYMTTVYCYDSKYYIIKKDKFFLAINAIYVNEDGTLNAPLNGLELNADTSIGGCVRRTVLNETYDHYINSGMSHEDALNSAMLLIDGYDIDEIKHYILNNERIEK